MRLSAMSVLVVAQSSSEILEGLMNNHVCNLEFTTIMIHAIVHVLKYATRTSKEE